MAAAGGMLLHTTKDPPLETDEFDIANLRLPNTAFKA
jgi:hypothetical protein